jgi:hypothetical protein
MTRIPFSVIVIIAVVVAVFGGRAISAQDKYTVQVPNGLAFSEFRGYEDWQVVAVSQSGDLIEVIVANPVMIEAYRAGGLPGIGKHFPDGSKMAKIHWNAKKSAEAPASDDSAGHAARRRFHGQGQQEISGHRRVGIRAVQL